MSIRFSDSSGIIVGIVIGLALGLSISLYDRHQEKLAAEHVNQLMQTKPEQLQKHIAASHSKNTTSSEAKLILSALSKNHALKLKQLFSGATCDVSFSWQFYKGIYKKAICKGNIQSKNNILNLIFKLDKRGTWTIVDVDGWTM